MRGRQIASTNPDWHAVNVPTDEEIQQADVVVVVKRIPDDLAMRLRMVKKHIVWDALDFWPQDGVTPAPQTVEDAKELARATCKLLRPTAIIAANRQMALDLHGLTKQVAHIYHHARLDAAPLQYAEVAYYDGSLKHAERWAGVIQAEFQKRGWFFVNSKPDRVGGVIVAVRDDTPASWISRRWKSNVKAANAMAYGALFMAQPEHGYIETMGGSAVYFSSDADIREAVRLATSRMLFDVVREEYKKMDSAPYTLAGAAAEYQRFFEGLKR
jgi:hypothetical protein